MSSKLTIAVISVLMLGTASAALADSFDYNPADRYPAYDSPDGRSAPYLGTIGQNAAEPGSQDTFRSAPVRLHQGRRAAHASAQSNNFAGQQDEIGVDLADHASSPYADR